MRFFFRKTSRKQIEGWLGIAAFYVGYCHVFACLTGQYGKLYTKATAKESSSPSALDEEASSQAEGPR